jgi:hypothetical protein
LVPFGVGMGAGSGVFAESIWSVSTPIAVVLIVGAAIDQIHRNKTYSITRI